MWNEVRVSHPAAAAHGPFRVQVFGLFFYSGQVLSLSLACRCVASLRILEANRINVAFRMNDTSVRSDFLALPPSPSVSIARCSVCATHPRITYLWGLGCARGQINRHICENVLMTTDKDSTRRTTVHASTRTSCSLGQYMTWLWRKIRTTIKETLAYLHVWVAVHVS